MSALSFADAVRASIEPIVTPRGFAAGQGETQVIFCAAADELASRLPRLSHVTESAGPGACIDLVVTADDRMNVARVELEGLSLEELMRDVGLSGRAAEVRDAMGRAPADALDVVASALRDLWAASE